jgi:hypothetical protein
MSPLQSLKFRKLSLSLVSLCVTVPICHTYKKISYIPLHGTQGMKINFDGIHGISPFIIRCLFIPSLIEPSYSMFCHSRSATILIPMFCLSHSPLPAKLIPILIPTYSPRS